MLGKVNNCSRFRHAELDSASPSFLGIADLVRNDSSLESRYQKFFNRFAIDCKHLLYIIII